MPEIDLLVGTGSAARNVAQDSLLLWLPGSIQVAPPDTFPLLAVPDPGGGMVAEVALYGILLALLCVAVALYAFRGYLPERPKWRGW